MSDTEDKEGVKANYLALMDQAAANSSEKASQYAMMSLAESAATYLAMLQGGYAQGIGDWLWQPAEEAGFTVEDYNLPTSPFWEEIAPIIMKRVIELKFPGQELTTNE